MGVTGWALLRLWPLKTDLGLGQDLDRAKELVSKKQTNKQKNPTKVSGKEEKFREGKTASAKAPWHIWGSERRPGWEERDWKWGLRDHSRGRGCQTGVWTRHLGTCGPWLNFGTEFWGSQRMRESFKQERQNLICILEILFCCYAIVNIQPLLLLLPSPHLPKPPSLLPQTEPGSWRLLSTPIVFSSTQQSKGPIRSWI